MSGIDHGLWATVGEAARILGVPVAAVQRAVNHGKLVSVRSGRNYFVRRADPVGFTPPPKRHTGRRKRNP